MSVSHSLPRLWSWFVLGLALGAMILFAPVPAHAGVVSETAEIFAGRVTDDPTAAKEIGNAVDALFKTLPNAGDVAHEAAGGARTVRPARGISGPFEELVVNFDKMACAAWIVSYRDLLLGLMLKRDPETPPETLAAAQDLLNKVIYGCRKIMDPESYQAGAVTGGGGGTATAPDEPRRATRVEVIDGELMISVSDNICWNRCRDTWLAWKGAAGLRQRAEASIRDKRQRADVLEQDTIPWLERRLAGAERRHADLLRRKPPSPRSDPAIDRQLGEVEPEIANLRTEIAARRAEVATLRAEAAALEQALPGLREAERAALKAYLDCLKSCKATADSAQDPSSWADKTIGKLQPRLDALDRQAAPPPPPAEDRRTSLAPRHVPESEPVLAARLNAIAALRTGEVTNSGTQVMPAFNASFGDGSDRVRRDARDAADQARQGEQGMAAGPIGETVMPVEPQPEFEPGPYAPEEW